MRLEFAKYTEVTKLAKELNQGYAEYERIFVCPDTNDMWLCRILKGYDYEYEKDENSYLLERNKIELPWKHYTVGEEFVKICLEEDDFCNWDSEQSYDLEELIEMVDGGFGIIEEKS